jgi:hypothetical protein
MTEATRSTEISVARDLRRRAVAYTRSASAHELHGLTTAAARERRMAAGMREMAALAETAPVEIGTSAFGASVLVAQIARRERRGAW